MDTGQQICVVFQATEAGGTISCHLEEIEQLVARVDGLSVQNWDITGGVCRMTLSGDKNEQWAQILVDQLNALEDKNGRGVIDAEMAYRSSGL